MNDSPQFDRSTDGSGATQHGCTHGKSAMLLVESLMHTLVEKALITRQEFIETVDSAAEVQQEQMSANALSGPDQNPSLLYPLATAFRRELGQ